MRSLARTRAAVLLALLVTGRASRAAPEDGVCIAFAGAEAGSVAAAQRGLGVPALRLDVDQPGQAAALAVRCGRLVVALGDRAARAAQAAAPGSPRVHALARTAEGPGVASDADPRRTLQTLQQLAPSARRIGAVYDPTRTGPLVAAARAAAQELGLELVALPVSSVGDAVRAFHRFEGELEVDALWLLPDGTATVQETAYYALELAHWRRMAVIGLSPWYVSGGALFALVPRPESAAAAAGELGALVLRGESVPGEVRAREEDLYLNRRTAGRLGLTIPSRLLDRAERVFQ